MRLSIHAEWRLLQEKLFCGHQTAKFYTRRAPQICDKISLQMCKVYPSCRLSTAICSLSNHNCPFILVDDVDFSIKTFKSAIARP